MISTKAKKQPVKNEKKEDPNLQFEKLIKQLIEDQGYVKESDMKQFALDILNQIEPLISNQVKKHFYENGKYIINNTNNSSNLENKDAKAS